MKRLIDQWTCDHYADIETMYRHLHDIAEVSWQERRTTDFLRSELAKMAVIADVFD